MKYLSLNPSSEEEISQNKEILLKYNFKNNIKIEMIFDIALKTFISEINKLGLANILTKEKQNKDLKKIHNKIYYKRSKTLKMIYTTDYIKESFFKAYKQNISLLLKDYLSKDLK